MKKPTSPQIVIDYLTKIGRPASYKEICRETGLASSYMHSPMKAALTKNLLVLHTVDGLSGLALGPALANPASEDFAATCDLHGRITLSGVLLENGKITLGLDQAQALKTFLNKVL